MAKFGVILFVLLAFGTLKSLILLEDSDAITAPDFIEPTFAFSFDPDFKKVGGADFIADALSNIGEVFLLIGENLVALFIGLAQTTALVFQFIFFLFQLVFTGIPGAPWYINVLIVLPFTIGLIYVVVALIRGGGDG